MSGKIFNIVLVVIAVSFLGCNQPAAYKKTEKGIANYSDNGGDDLNKVHDVSFIGVIANPVGYNGKKIRIIGYLNLEFEGNALYFHEEDYQKAISKNAIWLDISREKMRTIVYQKCKRKYVIVEGVYNSENNGHGDSFSGSISHISRLEIWWKP